MICRISESIGVRGLHMHGATAGGNHTASTARSRQSSPPHLCHGPSSLLQEALHALPNKPQEGLLMHIHTFNTGSSSAGKLLSWVGATAA